MKANELRIGNIIDTGFGQCYVSGIRENGGVIDLTSDIIENGWVLSNDAKPIPLTDKWLIGFGFIGNQTDPEYHRHYNIGEIEIEIPYDKSPMKISSVSNDWWLDTPIVYVHELQNLYYAIMKEELVLAAAPPCQ